MDASEQLPGSPDKCSHEYSPSDPAANVESLRKFPEIPVATKDQTSPRATCTSCVLREFCLPPGLSRDELASAEHLVSTRLRIKRGSALYRSGDAFRSLYVVRVGSLKSTVASDDAREQVTG